MIINNSQSNTTKKNLQKMKMKLNKIVKKVNMKLRAMKYKNQKVSNLKK